MIQSVVSFAVANESLRAVIEGLQPEESDNILAILGSGDQSFAMLEHGPSILAIDRDPDQIQHAKKRQQEILYDYHTDFFDLFGLSYDKRAKIKRDEYFLQEGRLERIRRNIDRLNINEEPQDIFEFSESMAGPFTKIYLSNAKISYYGLHTDFDQLRRRTEIMLSRLSPGGLIYFARGFVLDREYEKHQIGRPRVQLAEELTKAAHVCEKENDRYSWRPEVYRRVE